jgi:hypothetical protein
MRSLGHLPAPEVPKALLDDPHGQQREERPLRVDGGQAGFLEDDAGGRTAVHALEQRLLTGAQ